MDEHPPSEPLNPPLTAESPAAASDPSPQEPRPDLAVSAHEVTAYLLPLIDRAVQRAVAPLADTIAQHTITIDRLAAAIAALHAALPPRPASTIGRDAPTPRPHARAAYRDAHQDSADQHQDRDDTLDRRVRTDDRRTHDTGWTAPDRRLAARDRRAQQDRDRFEDAILAQYVPPRPTLVPPIETDDA